MTNFKKVDCSTITLGMRFTMPVFFDDGKNMFLARSKSVKKYHINAIQQWKIPYLLTMGEVIQQSNIDLEKSFVGFAMDDNVEELEEAEELEELEELD